MKRGFAMLVVLFVGSVLGACFREAVLEPVIRDAHAQPQAPVKEYKVVGGGVLGTEDTYQQALDKYAAAGWRFAGSIPSGNGPGKLVFER